jgi:hypothetical protein
MRFPQANLVGTGLLPSALATCLSHGELVIMVRVPSEADARVGTAGVVDVLCHTHTVA